ncbi:MAG TPA: CPBP family intramembrane glutamic endopeptidase [Bradyrhizobium sp.]|nr:CPBP family intramembrane glutamic endopeptidase [Bradyrhizobium sp.]
MLTSAVWALMHGQYDGFVIVQIFASGLFFGWLRWRTGSTLLTIILHMLANLTACVETAMKVEWMS